MTVDIISRSISVGPGRDRTRDPWIPRQTSICTPTRYRLRYAACRYLSYIYSLYVNNLSFFVVIRDLRIGQVHFIAHLL